MRSKDDYCKSSVGGMSGGRIGVGIVQDTCTVSEYKSREGDEKIGQELGKTEG